MPDTTNKDQNTDQPESPTVVASSTENTNIENTVANEAPQKPVIASGEPTKPQKQSSNVKVVASILGVILLLAAVGVGVFLVGQQQEIREQAQVSPVSCPLQPSPNAILVNFNQTVLKANNDEGQAKDGPIQASIPVGNYKVTLVSYFDHSNNSLQNLPQESYFVILHDSEGEQLTTTNSIGDLPSDQDFLTEEVNSNLSVTGGASSVTAYHSAYPTSAVNSIVPVCATFEPLVSELITQCLNIQAYDAGWNRLNNTDLSSLSAGDIINFTVGGTTSSGSIDMARFTINGDLLPDTTAIRPGTNDYYVEYTIPENVTTFTISSELHHSNLGWF